MSSGSVARAWGWVAHLRAGGTTPWQEWTGEAPAAASVLPGAQQLELLRRINLAGSSDSAHRGYSHLSTRLADRVLVAAAPGRGKPDLALIGVGASPYGPKPVDPALLPPDELIRVATSVLADDVVALGPPAPERQLRRVWRRGYHLAGDPLEAANVREHLTSSGRPPGGPFATTFVLGGPLDQMLADVWSHRCLERGSGGWLEWLRFWQQRDELPPRIDLAAVAQRHLARHHAVKVVLDPSRLPALLGARRLPPPSRPGADAAELARRINAVIGLLVPPDERGALRTDMLLGRMPITGTAPVAVPNDLRDWVRDAGLRMSRQLSRAGYPVVGDPAVVASVQPPRTSPSVASSQLVLDLAVRMLVDDTWKGLR